MEEGEGQLCLQVVCIDTGNFNARVGRADVGIFGEGHV